MSTITYRGGRDSTFFLASVICDRNRPSSYDDGILNTRSHPLAGNNHFDSTTKYFSDGQFFPFGWGFLMVMNARQVVLRWLLLLFCDVRRLLRLEPSLLLYPGQQSRDRATVAAAGFFFFFLSKLFIWFFQLIDCGKEIGKSGRSLLFSLEFVFFVKSNRFRFFVFFNQISRSWKCVFCSISCRQWWATNGIMDRHPQYAKPSR